MDEAPTSKKREIIAALAVLIIVVVIVGAVAMTNKKKVVNMSDTASTTPSQPADSTNTNGSTTSSATYKDGQYSATGSYESPGGNESIMVDVTLKGGVVTAISATSGAGDIEAMEYQNDFIGGYKSHVVGKKITNLSLSRVSGSSLTSQGFNSAIQKIKSEAKA